MIFRMTINAKLWDTRNSYWMVTAIPDLEFGIRKEQLMARLSEQGIASRPFFYPLSSLPAYEHLEQARQARQRNRVSYQISPYGVNLPCALNMSEDKVKYVCEVLKNILQQYGYVGRCT